ncbi:acylphosphatase-2-like [Gastrophryne carolinensis]
MCARSAPGAIGKLSNSVKIVKFADDTTIIGLIKNGKEEIYRRSVEELVIFKIYSMASELWSVDYEIYGDVQGVFFRKYTEDQAKKVAVVGWVKNTPYGTVTGQVQGSKDKVEIMKNWLKSIGSPMSRIDKAVFSNERQITNVEFSNFKTKY